MKLSRAVWLVCNNIEESDTCLSKMQKPERNQGFPAKHWIVHFVSGFNAVANLCIHTFFHVSPRCALVLKSYHYQLLKINIGNYRNYIHLVISVQISTETV